MLGGESVMRRPPDGWGWSNVACHHSCKYSYLRIVTPHHPPAYKAQTDVEAATEEKKILLVFVDVLAVAIATILNKYNSIYLYLFTYQLAGINQTTLRPYKYIFQNNSLIKK